MMRWLLYLLFPFMFIVVVIAMLVAPLVGAHFCPQEAGPLLGITMAGTSGMPVLLSRFRKRQKPHCCDPSHHH